MRADRNFRISAARACNPEHPQERPGFKFYKRCDIRDTAAYFNKKNYMDRVEANIYTMEGVAGAFREHPVEVAELPEMVAMLGSDLMSQRTNFRSHRMRKKEWQWD
eukprot:16449298-Heterocapsa_arctica.AAC.1